MEPERRGPLDQAVEHARSLFEESLLPTEAALGYRSTVGVFGGKLADYSGAMVYDMTGLKSRFDQTGDFVVRAWDDNVMKDPLEMLRRHPQAFFKFLFGGPKRYRGNPDEIAAHAAGLGLDDLFARHPKGIEITDPTLFTHGRPLQDIMRADLIAADSQPCDLVQADRLYAIGYAAQYMAKLHRDFGESHGGLGESTVGEIIFKDYDAQTGKVDNPVLNIPDVVYNSRKNISTIDQLTTDMLEYVMSVAIEELRRTDNWDATQKAIDTCFDAYENPKVAAMAKSYLKRGRVTLAGDEHTIGLSRTATAVRPVLSAHNRAHLRFDKASTAQLREMVIDVAGTYSS